MYPSFISIGTGTDITVILASVSAISLMLKYVCYQLGVFRNRMKCLNCLIEGYLVGYSSVRSPLGKIVCQFKNLLRVPVGLWYKTRQIQRLPRIPDIATGGGR